MTLDNILEAINKAKTIVLLGHENPDGDAIGSCLAMKLALEQMGKKADLIMPEYPKTFEFLPKTDEIKKESEIKEYDLAMTLDCASEKQINAFKEYFNNAKVKVSIDHHSTNTMFADYNYVNPDSPACAQLLLVIFSYFKIEVTKEIGSCVLAGIITDTGGFRYDNVTAETFEFVAKLCKKGIKVSPIYKQVFASKSKSKFELHRLALNRLEFMEDGKIAFTYITMEDEEKTNAQNGDYDGIVENGRDVEGVEVSIFLRETEKGIKISLRSNDIVNVSKVAMIFGGGGHIRAAGCTIQGTIDQVKNQIINTVKGYLNK